MGTSFTTQMPTQGIDEQSMSLAMAMPRITARVFIENDGKYLYLQQTEERGGELSLPGGRVKNKEFVRKGLLREIQEETNLMVNKKSLQAIHTLHRKENGEFEIVIFFKATVDCVESLALNEPHKFSGFAWVDANEIPAALIKEFRHAMKQVAKGRIFSEFPRKKRKDDAVAE